MSALRRATRHPATTTTASAAGFERARLSAAAAGIGLAPGLNEPAGLAVDLERVLAGIPRRPLPTDPAVPASHIRRARGRWPRTPFHLPNAARMWIRGRGRRR